MPADRWPDRGETSASDRCRGLSQNYDKDQNQDHQDKRARTQEYDCAHGIGLQQVVATHKSGTRKDWEGRWARVTASCLEAGRHF
jgi:hypothetical protein